MAIRITPITTQRTTREEDFSIGAGPVTGAEVETGAGGFESMVTTDGAGSTALEGVKVETAGMTIRVGVCGAALFLAVALFAGAFFAATFLAGAFLAATFLTATFLAGAFFATAFLTVSFFAATFLAGAFFAATFLTAAFLAVFLTATGDSSVKCDPASDKNGSS